MKKAILILVITLTFASCQKSKEVSKIVVADWLLGNWENKSKDGDLLESWKKVNDSIYDGESYFIKGKDTFIVSDPEKAHLAADYIKKNNFEKVAIISQTTMSVYGYKKLIDELNSIMDNGKFEEIHLSMKDLNKKYGYVDTICNPTKQRQVGTEELAKEADVMIVIGGKNSSNS